MLSEDMITSVFYWLTACVVGGGMKLVVCVCVFGGENKRGDS